MIYHNPGLVLFLDSSSAYGMHNHIIGDLYSWLWILVNMYHCISPTLGWASEKIRADGWQKNGETLNTHDFSDSISWCLKYYKFTVAISDPAHCKLCIQVLLFTQSSWRKSLILLKCINHDETWAFPLTWLWRENSVLELIVHWVTNSALGH